MLRALSAKFNEHKSYRTWLDFGAIEHCMKTINLFERYQTLNTTMVETCSGTVHKVGEGNARFNFS